MTISDELTIDFISRDPDTLDVVLTISDHLDWNNASHHLSLLQRKLNTYLAFVESGELISTYPSANGRTIRFEVVGKYPLTGEVRQSYEALENYFRELGYEFVFRRLGDQEH